MARKIIEWGTDESFIENYMELKSSRKMGELYNCDKTSVLNHAKKIGFNPNNINREYKKSIAQFDNRYSLSTTAFHSSENTQVYR